MIPTDSVVYARFLPRKSRPDQAPRRLAIFDTRFDEARGWHEVSRLVDTVVSEKEVRVDMAVFLSELREDDANPNSPLIFEVRSKKEIEAIQAKERREAAMWQPRGSENEQTLGDLIIGRPAV